MGSFPNPETSFKPGQSGNPNGRPKGKSLATIIRELESDEFDWKHVPIKNKDAVKEMGSPFKAIVYVALGQAISGDKSAREWLRKAGYGDKLDITTDGQQLQAATIIDLGNLNANQSKTE
jgi:hypothetical protein